MTQFKIIHNVETNEITQVELSDEEIQKQLQEEQELLSRFEKESAIQAKRAALLEKLGITEEEARLLLGGN